MDVIHCQVNIISRNKGRSAVAAAAYRSAERLYNEHNGTTYDFTKKQGVVYQKILLPGNAPKSYYDRETLWNAVEFIEKSKNARTAREVEVALPIELNRASQINLTLNYVKENFVNQGMCADINIHDKGNGNPHVHILLTTRSLDEHGNWMMKQRKNYILDDDGNKIYDPVKKRYKCGKSIKTNDWDNQGNVQRWRQAWADSCNRAFERNGVEKTVTHESYRLQGIDREPTKHLGPAVSALERRGIDTDRSIENRKIIERNLEKDRQRERQLNRKRARGRSR